MTAGGIKWTDAQREAIRTIDRSVLVSAAAGSGKTAVLAERCAHIVCDAPPEARCDIDRLLVVTFTEAAAAEMKERIRRAIQDRSAASPADRRLRAQAALVDTAQISTLHAFCLWMVRRWFDRLAIDPMAQLLDEDEGRLLRQETLTILFDARYASKSLEGDAFRALVEAYGLGADGGIATFVLHLAGFLESRPDAEAWLASAGESSESKCDWAVEAIGSALSTELARQAEQIESVIAHTAWEGEGGVFYRGLVERYGVALAGWQASLEAGKLRETVRAEIMAFELSAKGSPRFSKDADPALVEARDRARNVFTPIRDTLLKKRLQTELCRFSESELREGWRQTQTYVATLCGLTSDFMKAYARTKSAMGVMDFADLERFAHRLLTEDLGDQPASTIVAELRRRFDHVLVDEFQDINPLQAKLLECVSREGDAASAGNLFTVGDVKQSIYRFRLAEPSLFLDRMKACRDEVSLSRCIDLQSNFRSTRRIIDAANAVFRLLLREDCGGIAYDKRDELRVADEEGPFGDHVELHILDRQIDDRGDEETDSDEPRYVDVTDPKQWRSVEREAYLIGERIQSLFEEGFAVAEGDGERLIAYRDICILLRSTRHSAVALVEMLGRMGIPARADSAGDMFAAAEVGDVLALLRVLDNGKQDIPLAAVLRSGVLGVQLCEDELVEIRAIDRSGAFHECVEQLASRTQESGLRGKLETILRRLARYRRLARVKPLADVLWTIYQETGFLARVGGMERGRRRRANLIALHERARQFGQFRRQGLHRFLRFVETLEAEGDDLGASPAVGEAEDVVRVMSIHKAKGLEFPVVFVAEAGRRFNLGDAAGRMLFDRSMGIGIKAVDRERLIEYPTVLHRLCARESREASIAEELRVWYVAMTRAKQKLIVVGSDELDSVETIHASSPADGSRLGVLDILTARSPLRWIVAALGHLPKMAVSWNVPSGDETLYEVSTHGADTIRNWRIEAPKREAQTQLFHMLADLAELPPEEPRGADAARAEGIIQRLDFAYANLGASSIRAVRAASEVKRRYQPRSDHEEAVAMVQRPRAEGGRAGSSSEAARRGQAFHTALQFIRLEQVTTAASVAAEIERLKGEEVLDTEDAGFIDVDAIAWFFATELGARIREASDCYLREWMFLASEPVALFEPDVSADGDDRVLIRGVVDGILATGASLEVIDFKTDRVSAEAVSARAAEYAMQIQIYARAVARIYGRPVDACHLVFLDCRQVVEMSGGKA